MIMFKKKNVEFSFFMTVKHIKLFDFDNSICYNG